MASWEDRKAEMYWSEAKDQGRVSTLDTNGTRLEDKRPRRKRL